MRKEIVVPFKNKEEFMKAWKIRSLPWDEFMRAWGLNNSLFNKLDMRLKVKGETYVQRVKCVTDEGLLFVNSDKVMNWTEVLAKCNFLDGTECGRKIKIVDDSKKYRPFQFPQEFLEFYHLACGKLLPYGNFESILSYSGIWLKTENNIYENVIRLEDKGLYIAHSDGIVTWEDLSNRYSFLDGSICGVSI